MRRAEPAQGVLGKGEPARGAGDGVRLRFAQPAELCGPIGRVQTAAGALPDGLRVKFLAERRGLGSRAGVGPVEDGGGRFPRGIDAHQAVPERGGPDGRHVAGTLSEAGDDPIDSAYGDVEERFGTEGGSPVRGGLQRVPDLLFALQDVAPFAVAGQGAHGRGAGVERNDEWRSGLGQRNARHGHSSHREQADGRIRRVYQAGNSGPA